MEEENELPESDNQKLNDDVNADLLSAMNEIEGNAEPKDDVAADKPEGEEEKPEQPAEEEVKPPQSWGAAVKSEWANLPPTVRAEILKRENDMHRALTSHDGELQLGRAMKEVVSPYMAIIQAEGGTPASTVSSMLNTAYILRTGSPEQKKELILTTAKQFGVDLGLGEEEYVDPTIASLQREIQQLRQLADPANIRNTLTQEIQQTKVEADIKAFASDPAHEHFETVRPLMASLISTGCAKDLKEAYDMACMAHPVTRSTLEAAKAAELEAKRKQENAAKRRAASSVTGSPATPSNSKATNPKSSVEDDLRAAFEEFETRV